MQTTIDLDADVLHRAEKVARGSNRTLSAVIEEALRASLSLPPAGTLRQDDEFWHPLSLADLAQRQGVVPIDSAQPPSASFWADDDIDEFVAAVRAWRADP